MGANLLGIQDFFDSRYWYGDYCTLLSVSDPDSVGSADPAPDWESRSAPRHAKIGPKKGKKEGQAVFDKKIPN